MNINVYKKLIILLILFFTAVNVQSEDDDKSQQKKKLEGNWAITIKKIDKNPSQLNGKNNDYFTDQIHYMSLNEGNLNLKLGETSVAIGTIKGTKIKIAYPINGVNYDFKGSVLKQHLRGTAYTEDKNVTYSWSAYKLERQWVCENHNPIHIAENLQEMQNLTKEKQCTGWHRP